MLVSSQAPTSVGDSAMTAIVTSLLGGGWILIAGWILPTALNSLLFAVFVLPALRNVPIFQAAVAATGPAKALALFVAAVIIGLLLSAFQTPFYRVLEGYRGLPDALKKRRTDHHIERKHELDKRLRMAQLARHEALGSLSHRDRTELASLRDDISLRHAPEQKHKLTSWQISVLAERRRRYPVQDDQVLPTLLGNAIRRFEEYGYDRYRIDAVTMWNALAAVVPETLRKQIDVSRASVDFFVCLIYGHLVLAVSGVTALIIVPGYPLGPIVAIVVPIALSPLWYRLAVEATDEWAAAFRALVDLGRKPLADSLGLALPTTLKQERRMWELASRLSRRAFQDSDFELDEFRASSGANGRTDLAK
jgi:hypothetical protein